MENKRKLGMQKEQLAAEYLISNGVVILEKNFYFSGGEIDLIARDGEYLCFIEVKYRKSNQYGFPEDAVITKKQKTIIAGAKKYFYQHRLSFDTPCRFDIVSIYQEHITWLPNAFELK